MSDMFVAFLNAGYGASYGKLEWERHKAQQQRIQNELEQQARRRYRQLEYYLRKEGLIRKSSSQGTRFVITGEGKMKRTQLRARKQKDQLPPIASYKGASSERWIIVVFDVPEQERQKRNWLRAVLECLGFVMLQKSVWIGKVVLPRSFLRDLAKLRLSDYVEIVGVTKMGSLRRRKQ